MRIEICMVILLLVCFTAMIMCAFGQHILDYITNLCQGHIDYLQRLPEPVIKRILQYVGLEDIARISVLNRSFHQVGFFKRPSLSLHRSSHTP